MRIGGFGIDATEVQPGWADAQKKFKGQGDEAWAKFWEEYRVKTLGLAPSEA